MVRAAYPTDGIACAVNEMHLMCFQEVLSGEKWQ
jgi:hypothetical protein